MIDKNIMYGCHCDNCGEHWIDEESGLSVCYTENDILNEVRNFESWHTEGPFGNEKHYCPDCFKITDEDKLVIDMTRTKPLEDEQSFKKDDCIFKVCQSPTKCKLKNICRHKGN